LAGKAGLEKIMDTDRYDSIPQNESENQDSKNLKNRCITNLSKSGYFRAPDAIFDLNLSANAMLVLLNLYRRADKEGRSFPSKNRIARDCGFSKRTTDRAVKELINRGIVKIDPRPGLSSLYFLDNSIGEYSSAHLQNADTESEPLQNLHPHPCKSCTLRNTK